jgi:flagellar basal-body rod protein FlgC
MGDGAFSSFDISASGMTAERVRMNVFAQNIANAHTTRTEEGGPYKRQRVFFEEVLGDAQRELNGLIGDVGAGVRVVEISRDMSAGPKVHDPDNPDADKDGYVELPNVNIIDEWLNMMTATRGYEANVAAIGAAKQMILKALDI